ncbi:ABC transporter permease [Microbacterium sp. 18062]|uniref:ABC transporter permease n=1 Tax=Microbacterium sp. 18062 TaxID=2681410 RepID=UPI00190FBE16|nr:ABC transporter permease [Microbacterium sp. 18062]
MLIDTTTEPAPQMAPSAVQPSGPVRDLVALRRRRVLAETAAWLVRILLTWIASVIAFAVLAFFLVKLVPGDPVLVASGGRLSGEDYERARAELGLDLPLWQQFGEYLMQLLRLDLGTSIVTGRPVAEDLAVRVPATLELITLGLAGGVIAALLLSHLVVTHKGSWWTRPLIAYARSAGALPEYVLGIAFIFVFYTTLRLAPAPTGRLSPMLIAPPTTTGFSLLDALIAGDLRAFGSYAEHLTLPVLVMIVAHTAILMKTMIPSLDAAIDAPSTRFRIASGASRRAVYIGIYRSALPSMITMLGMLFGLFVGGAVVLEALFGLGGTGQYAVDAVNGSDVYALRSVLVVIAAVCLAVYLLIDIVNGVLDPRRRTGRKTEA